MKQLAGCLAIGASVLFSAPIADAQEAGGAPSADEQEPSEVTEPSEQPLQDSQTPGGGRPGTSAAPAPSEVPSQDGDNPGYPTELDPANPDVPAGDAPATGDGTVPPPDPAAAPPLSPPPSPPPPPPAQPAVAPVQLAPQEPVTAAVSTDQVQDQAVGQGPTRSAPLGFAVGLGLGVALCHTSGCSDYGESTGPGLSAAFEVGFRPIHFVELVLDAGFQYHGVEADVGPSDLEGTGRGLNASGGVRVYPLRLGAFDPYVAGLIGYSVFRSSFSDDSDGVPHDYEHEITRHLLKLQIGADYYLTNQLAIGGVFSYEPQFSGHSCIESSGGDTACGYFRERGIGDPREVRGPGDQPEFLVIALTGRMHF